VAQDLKFTTVVEAVEVSATPRGDGTEDVVARSPVPLGQATRQFLRVQATLP
jgi:hypothetical protein